MTNNHRLAKLYQIKGGLPFYVTGELLYWANRMTRLGIKMSTGEFLEWWSKVHSNG